MIRWSASVTVCLEVLDDTKKASLLVLKHRMIQRRLLLNAVSSLCLCLTRNPVLQVL